MFQWFLQLWLFEELFFKIWSLRIQKSRGKTCATILSIQEISSRASLKFLPKCFEKLMCVFFRNLGPYNANISRALLAFIKFFTTPRAIEGENAEPRNDIVTLNYFLVFLFLRPWVPSLYYMHLAWQTLSSSLIICPFLHFRTYWPNEQRAKFPL